MSSSFSFNLPVINKSNGLKNIESLPPVEMNLTGIPNNEKEKRSFNQLIKILVNGHVDDFGSADWDTLCRRVEVWHLLSEAKQQEYAFHIWQAVATDKLANKIIISKLFQGLTSQGDDFPTCLTNSFHIAIDFLPDELDKQKLKWLYRFREGQYKECIQILREQNKTPLVLFEELGFSIISDIRSQLNSMITMDLNKHLDDDIEHWLTNCLNDLSVDEQAKHCDKILSTKYKSNLGVNLLTWLEVNCLPMVDNGLWRLLNERAKRQLASVFSINDYYIVESIAQSITSPDVVSSLNLKGDEARQIKSRVRFWKNYSDGIMRVIPVLDSNIKQFLPRFIYKSHSQCYFIDLNKNYGVIPVKNSAYKDFTPGHTFNSKTKKEKFHSVNAIILEFKKWIVVQVLYGETSDLRIYKKNLINSSALLENPIKSWSKVRNLIQDYVSDNESGWQFDLEVLLREKLNIMVNQDLLIKDAYLRYGFLYPLDDDAILARKISASKWQENFWKNEFSSGKYNLSD
jgi:hypothetical protein